MTRHCVVCDRPNIRKGCFCPACRRSYDRNLARHGEPIIAVIEWTAKRARKAETKRVLEKVARRFLKIDNEQ